MGEWDTDKLVMKPCDQNSPLQVFGKSVRGFIQDGSRCLAADDNHLATMKPMTNSGETPCNHYAQTPWTTGTWSMTLARNGKEKCMGSCHDNGDQLDPQIEMNGAHGICDAHWHLVPAPFPSQTKLDGGKCGGFVGSWLQVGGALVELVLNGDNWGTATFHETNVTSGAPYLVYPFEVDPTQDPCRIRLHWWIGPDGTYMDGQLSGSDTIQWTSPGGVWQRAAEPVGTCTLSRYDTAVLQVGAKKECAFDGQWLPTDKTADIVHIKKINAQEGVAMYNFPFPYTEKIDFITDTECRLALHEGGSTLPPKGAVLSDDGTRLTWDDPQWGYWTKGAGNEACDACSGHNFELGGPQYRCYSPEGGSCLLAPDEASCLDVMKPDAVWCPPGNTD